MTPRRILAVGLSGNTRMRGVERVVFESLHALAGQTGGDPQLQIELLMGPWQVYYRPLRADGIRLREVTIPRHLAARHLYCWLVVPWLSRGYDVLHLFNTLPLASSFAATTLVTIHDIAEFDRPDKYGRLQAGYRRLVVRHLLHVVDGVLTVSQFSRRRIEDFFPSARVEVIANGVDHLRPPGGEPGPAGADGGYFLYYGVIERTKGLDRALAAFVRMKAADPACGQRFVIAGEAGNLSPSIAPYLARDDVDYLGFVDDERIAGLARAATAVVFLSEYEGFGFPALETLVLGGRVVVSRGTVLEELCSPYCLLADPCDTEATAAALARAAAGDFGWSPAEAARQVRARLTWAAAARLLGERYRQR